MDRFGVARIAAGVTFLIVALWWVTAAYSAKEEPKPVGIPPEKVAGFVHAVDDKPWPQQRAAYESPLAWCSYGPLSDAQ